ncbi:MAG: L-aspartate oxidase [Bacteroidales bacterium]|nr:L-aspartate oxidase [Bacteroidales bacterium]
MRKKYDYLVIGSGAAGLSYALKVAENGKVALVSKTTLEVTNTSKAQGGIAAVTDIEKDNYEKHIIDTHIAGAGICDPDTVRLVITKAPEQIKQLLEWGTDFDKKADGQFDLHKEGGHSEFRILHHLDNTGEEIQRALISQIKNHPNIDVYENHFAIDIITQHHLGRSNEPWMRDIKCYGAYVLNEKTHEIITFLSKVTMMATGGVGNVYQVTTNPTISTGDGIAMVFRAKGIIKGMEFIQFHPTSLYNPQERPNFLITEAMRGYGAILKLKDGSTFMEKYDERGCLAPRDIVARAIDNEMKISGDDFVYLDVTHKNPEETKHHFPMIYNKCLSIGIDITKEMIPVVPAAHYLCGGIKVDLNGRSSINNLYAAGECSCTGLHGANRLASNSLLEAIVYADVAAKDSTEVMRQTEWREDVPDWDDEGTVHNEEMILITQANKEVETIMSNYVGIVRSNLRLKRALDRLEIIYRETEDLYNASKVSMKLCELRNKINIGYLIIKMAQKRHESRGLHYTLDYKERNKKLDTYPID